MVGCEFEGVADYGEIGYGGNILDWHCAVKVEMKCGAHLLCAQ